MCPLLFHLPGFSPALLPVPSCLASEVTELTTVKGLCPLLLFFIVPSGVCSLQRRKRNCLAFCLSPRGLSKWPQKRRRHRRLRAQTYAVFQCWCSCTYRLSAESWVRGQPWTFVPLPSGTRRLHWYWKCFLIQKEVLLTMRLASA